MSIQWMKAGVGKEDEDPSREGKAPGAMHIVRMFYEGIWEPSRAYGKSIVTRFTFKKGVLAEWRKVEGAILQWVRGCGDDAEEKR